MTSTGTIYLIMGLLILVVVIIIAVVGYYVSQRSEESTETPVEETVETPSTTETTETKTEVQKTPGFKVDLYKHTTSGFGEKIGSEIVDELYFNWGEGNILSSKLSDNVGFKAMAKINVEQPTKYRFKLTIDDGSKLFINGVEQKLRKSAEDGAVSDSWISQGSTSYYTDLVTIDKETPIQVDFFEGGGSAQLLLEWKKEGEENYTRIPKELIFH